MIATDQSQSQRLLACGVPAETADMFYDSSALSLMDYDSAVHERDSRRESYEVIPAWSLSAVMELLPKQVTAPHGLTLCNLRIPYYPRFCVVMYHDGKDSGDPEDYMWQCDSENRNKSLIEACVKAIEFLTANGYKLNEIKEK